MDAPSTLLEDAACYACLNFSVATTLRLASLSRLASAAGAGVPDYTSPLLDLTTPSINGGSTGFGKAPSLLRGVLVCTADDGGWGVKAGEEVDCFLVWNPTNGFFNFDMIAQTNGLITVWNKSAQLGNEADVYLSGNGSNPTSLGNFMFRVYAWK